MKSKTAGERIQRPSPEPQPRNGAPEIPFALTVEANETVNASVYALKKALKDAGKNFVSHLGKDGWWSDPDSIFHWHENARRFNDAKQYWLGEVTAAISKHFSDIVKLGISEPNSSPSAVVHWAEEIVDGVLRAECRPEEALRLSMIDWDGRMPRGVPEIYDSTCPSKAHDAKSLSKELRNVIDEHLQVEKSKALVRAVLDARAEKDHTRIEQPRTKPSPVNHRAEWPRTLYQAVVACGPDAPYQVVANWISENHPYVQATESYARKDEQDLGVLVRTDEKARAQFQKDLNKARKEYSQTYPTRT